MDYTVINGLYCNYLWNPALSREITFVVKFNQINLEFLNQTKNILVILLSSLFKIVGKSVQGFLSYDPAYRYIIKHNVFTAHFWGMGILSWKMNSNESSFNPIKKNKCVTFLQLKKKSNYES